MMSLNKSRAGWVVAVFIAAFPSVAAASDWKGQFGINLAGGAGQTGSPTSDYRINRQTRSMTYGAGEFEFGATDMNDDGLATGRQWAIILRNVAFGPAAWDRHGGTIGEDHDQPAWSGGGVGLRGGYTYGQLETNMSFLVGSSQAAREKARAIDGENQRRMTRSFFQPGIGLGLTLMRGRSFDLKLRAAYEPMFFDERLEYRYSDGASVAYTDRLNAHHLGLSFTFYPGQSHGGGTDGTLHFFGNCGSACGELMVQTGRVLVEVGSVVGRAAAEGLFRALAH